MNQKFEELVNKRLELIKSVLLSKGKEYATEQNPFHNFENGVHISTCDTPEQYMWTLATKHFQSIKDMLENPSGKYHEDYIREKLGDAINYLVLIEASLLWKEKEL